MVNKPVKLYGICKGGYTINHTIMPFRKADLSLYAGLYKDVFNHTPWCETWTLETALERLGDLYHTPKFLGYVLYQGETVIGFIAGNCKRSDIGTTFYIAELCISNEVQGQGCGSRLLRHLENELKKKDVANVYLLTAANGTVQHFYAKHRYESNEKRIIMKKTI